MCSSYSLFTLGFAILIAGCIGVFVVMRETRANRKAWHSGDNEHDGYGAEEGADR